MGATGPKRTPLQREVDRRDIAALALAGHTHAQIARTLSDRRPYALSRSQVGRDLSASVARWRVEASADIGEMVAEELARIAYTESQLWDAWHASTEDLVSEREVVGRDGRCRRITRRVERIGDPRILEAIRRCGARRFELLGLSGRDRRTGDVVGSAQGPAGGLLRRVDELVEELAAVDQTESAAAQPSASDPDPALPAERWPRAEDGVTSSSVALSATLRRVQRPGCADHPGRAPGVGTPLRTHEPGSASAAPDSDRREEPISNLRGVAL